MSLLPMLGLCADASPARGCLAPEIVELFFPFCRSHTDAPARECSAGLVEAHTAKIIAHSCVLGTSACNTCAVQVGVNAKVRKARTPNSRWVNIFEMRLGLGTQSNNQ